MRAAPRRPCEDAWTPSFPAPERPPSTIEARCTAHNKDHQACLQVCEGQLSPHKAEIGSAPPPCGATGECMNLHPLCICTKPACPWCTRAAFELYVLDSE